MEKRDNPELLDKPVIVGGGKRGVVATACYIARIYGVKSAMPMFKAMAVCPKAVVIRPNMNKYSKVGNQIHKLMLETTPLVETISIDEAFLDLKGTQRLHQAPPAETLVNLAARIFNETGIHVSIGLSFNKFLAKMASDIDKPRGFSVIGKTDATAFLSPRPVHTIWGVGNKLHQKLQRDGFQTIGDLQRANENFLIKRYGIVGKKLARFSRGTDERIVNPTSKTKSVSTETTFNSDLNSIETMSPILWNLCENLSSRIKTKGISGKGITLKLKTSGFKIVTRRVTLNTPTQLADQLYRATLPILTKELNGRQFRLLGIGLSLLSDTQNADPVDLADPNLSQRMAVEFVMDKVRNKLGHKAIQKGRSFQS